MTHSWGPLSWVGFVNWANVFSIDTQSRAGSLFYLLLFSVKDRCEASNNSLAARIQVRLVWHSSWTLELPDFLFQVFLLRSTFEWTPANEEESQHCNLLRILINNGSMPLEPCFEFYLCSFFSCKCNRIKVTTFFPIRNVSLNVTHRLFT